VWQATLDPTRERLTRTSDAVAGDAFSAPELQDNPKLLDPRCDIYSLGATWYWLLTGCTPRGTNLESKLRGSVTVSPEYERVLLRCLDQPEKRYQSAADLRADISAIEAGGKPAPSPQELNDEQARFLGAVVGACPTTRHRISFYRLEQEVASQQSRLRTTLALRSLLSRNFLAEHTEVEFSDEYSVYSPTPEGIAWADRHVDRVEQLLSKQLPADDHQESEIPF
jgi:serine/threonine protein kinase